MQLWRKADVALHTGAARRPVRPAFCTATAPTALCKDEPSHWRATGGAAKLARMKMHKLLLLAVACTWAMGASAQWQWIDKDGRKVFSDRPPPQEIPEKSILKQPGGQRPARAPAPAAGAEGADAPQAGAAAAPAPKVAASSTKDKELEQKKAAAEAAEAAKAKAEQEKIAKAQAENCTRARQAKATYDSGRIITQTNAQGERVFMDEAARNAETKRIDGIIATDCKR